MIGLLPTAYTLVSTLLLHRLRLECEGFLDSDQAGSRQHRGTRDHVGSAHPCATESLARRALRIAA